MRESDPHLFFCFVFFFQEVHVHVVDLSETHKVWEFAEAFKKQHPSLNVLVGITLIPVSSITPQLFGLTSSVFSRQINNAGCMVHKRELNADGLEKNFATNTMGETSFCWSNCATLL